MSCPNTLIANWRLSVPIAAALCTASCGADAPLAQLDSVPATQMMHLDHTPPIATASEQKEPVAPDHTLQLRVSLALRNESELDKLLEAQHDPNSPHYHRYLTPEEFRERFHPTSAHVEQVQAAMAEHGITAHVEAHGTVVHAHATAKQAESFFNTKLYHFESPEGARFHAPDRPIAVPQALGIRAVRGLATPPKPHSNYVLRNEDIHRAVAPPTFNAAQIRQAYNIPETYKGKNARLALVELDGYDPADIATYAKKNKIRQVPLKNILIDGFDGQVHDSSAQVEVTMDIQLMNALAPQAEEIRVYEAPNGGSGFFDMFNEMANPQLGDRYMPTIISCSWGVPEDQTTLADVQAEAAIFKQMAAQGQTMFSASGDSGARDDGVNLGVDDPAAQPYVVGVGGTTLSARNGSYGREKAWLNGGGGISQYWRIPTWQRAAVKSLSRGSTTRRNVPDVSLNADPETGYVVYVAGSTQIVGGTSCAAPLWGAFLGLANEARAEKKLAPLGFLSPKLYSLGAAEQTTGIYHDIDDRSTNGFYPAIGGYDNATGWGSFNGAPLIEALAQE
jgi:kumamolisin